MACWFLASWGQRVFPSSLSTHSPSVLPPFFLILTSTVPTAWIVFSFSLRTRDRFSESQLKSSPAPSRKLSLTAGHLRALRSSCHPLPKGPPPSFITGCMCAFGLWQTCLSSFVSSAWRVGPGPCTSDRHLSDLEKLPAGHHLLSLPNYADFDHLLSRTRLYLVHTEVAPVAREFRIGATQPLSPARVPPGRAGAHTAGVFPQSPS